MTYQTYFRAYLRAGLSSGLASLLMLFLALAQNSYAQNTPASSTLTPAPTAGTVDKVAVNDAPKPGSIKGRVVDGEDQPIPNVPVMAFPIGQRGAGRIVGPGQSSQATTDDEGNFQISGLMPSSYSIQSSAPGYVSMIPQDESGAGVWHIGEVANIRLVKGGVITGRVLDLSGEPMTGINVSAIRIGDVEGEDDFVTVAGGFTRPWRTDDTGAYRIYGLPPGTYVVRAGGSNNGPPNGASPFRGDAPTYYPSSARGNAVPVAIQPGQEATGIDIQYRGEKGRTISGKVVGQSENGGRFGGGGVQVSLTLAGTDTVIASGFQIARGRGANSDGFALQGIPDGEYEIIARGNGFDNDSVSIPRRVSVRGVDVNGIELTLSPLGLLNGRVVLEKSPSAEAAVKAESSATVCQSPRRSRVEEILLTPERETAGAHTASAIERLLPVRSAVPTVAGEFTLRDLTAGRWRINTQLPDENWYVRAISLNAPAVKTVRKTSSPTSSPTTSPVQAGINLKSGEKVSGLTIAVAEGAAGLKGKLVPASGVKLAGKTLVHLIPVEKEAADDLLRYAQTMAGKDGQFSFRHLAPGRYYLLSAKITDAAQPVALDNAKRIALRRAAEAAGIVVELQPCQRLTDYALSVK